MKFFSFLIIGFLVVVLNGVQSHAQNSYRVNSNPNLIKSLSKAHGKVKELAQEGAVAISKREFEKARVIYQQIVETAPDNPLAYGNLGVVEFQLKNYGAAELALMKSVEINPSLAEYWTSLGIVQFKRNQYFLAISSLSRAIHEDPRSAQAHLYLSAIYYEKGWTHAAIENLSRVVELDPKNAEAQYNLALTYFTLSEPKVELAKRHYYNAIDLGFPKSESFEKRLLEGSE